MICIKNNQKPEYTKSDGHSSSSGDRLLEPCPSEEGAPDGCQVVEQDRTNYVGVQKRVGIKN
uniref:Uncharacterized protein n=1 Tax=uncultured gamma proteobacterium HF0500_32L01 TaxID=723574 RepID=E7C5Z7_9GAMM|nr:hypothetical protein [uncultured gamma proteobacterium HF0500_32L01]